MPSPSVNHSTAAIRFSRGKDRFDNAPAQQVAANFDQFERLVLADRSPHKGLAFIGAPLLAGPHPDKPDKYPGPGHWRVKHLVEPRQFLAFDFDGFADADSFQAALAYLARYRGFGYTTASHTPQAPRARAILALNRLIGRDEGINVGQAIQATMLEALGASAVKFDDSVYRGEQPVYTPVTTSEAFHFAGDAVDVDAWLSSSPINAITSPPLFQAAAASLNADLTGHVFMLPDQVVDGDGRENIVLKYAGHLRGKGLDQPTIERIVRDYNQLHIKPPLTESVALDRARRYEQARPLPAANDGAMPDPVELSESLPRVPRFLIKLLPKAIGAYVQDVAERMNCPVDFPAVAAMVALAAAIGSRIHCRPYSNDTWMVPGGAWGMVVSPPGTIKSPPLFEMLRPLIEMDKQAAQQYALDLEQYQISRQIYDYAVKVAVKAGVAPVGLLAPVEPTMTRYLVNDSTYEMLVAIAAANPNGFLIWRDELVGWFHSLNKENQKEARGLYLTGWTGTESYATDRIGRGHVRADRVNLSLLGTIQPNVLRQIVYDAVVGGGGDDGLVPRIQLAVYPDPIRTFTKVDRRPNYVAMQNYEDKIKQLVALDPASVGASFAADGTPYLPFDDAAQLTFDDWRQTLEDRIRAPDTEEHPAMLAHLGKYRSLFPKLALVLHLAAGHSGPISNNAALRARAWTQYLEAHARRIYHTATNRIKQSAVALANKITANKLTDGFTRSDVLVKEWAGLRNAEEVATALTVLRDGNWLSVIEDRSTGGRPAERHYINPKVKRVA